MEVNQTWQNIEIGYYYYVGGMSKLSNRNLV